MKDGLVKNKSFVFVPAFVFARVSTANAIGEPPQTLLHRFVVSQTNKCVTQNNIVIKKYDRTHQQTNHQKNGKKKY